MCKLSAIHVKFIFNDRRSSGTYCGMFYELDVLDSITLSILDCDIDKDDLLSMPVLPLYV